MIASKAALESEKIASPSVVPESSRWVELQDECLLNCKKFAGKTVGQQYYDWHDRLSDRNEEVMFREEVNLFREEFYKAAVDNLLH
ncbi:hypothetical protein TNCV_4140481 [Trichonephila clavipes]|nr:hypothetical protein TNCV_4140481 [Trichonephila clavipes]